MNMLRNWAMIMLATTILITSSISTPLRGALTFAASLAGGTVAGAYGGPRVARLGGSTVGHMSGMVFGSQSGRRKPYEELSLRNFRVSERGDIKILTKIESFILEQLKGERFNESALCAASTELLSNDEFYEYLSSKLNSTSSVTGINPERGLEALRSFLHSDDLQGSDKYSALISLDSSNVEEFTAYIQSILPNTESTSRSLEMLARKMPRYNQIVTEWFESSWKTCLRNLYDQEISISAAPLQFKRCQKILSEQIISTLNCLYNLSLGGHPFTKSLLSLIKSAHREGTISIENQNRLLEMTRNARACFAAAGFSLDLVEYIGKSGAVRTEMPAGNKVGIVVKDAAKGAVIGGLAGGGIGYYMGGGKAAIKGAKYGAVVGATLGAGYATAHDIERRELMPCFQSKLEAQMCFLQMTVSAINEGIREINEVFTRYLELLS